VTVKIDRDALSEWEISQDDFGGPLIFHRHNAVAVPAYVIGGADGEQIAQCSDCMEFLELSKVPLESAR
jgi:hypothetical protein